MLVRESDQPTLLEAFMALTIPDRAEPLYDPSQRIQVLIDILLPVVFMRNWVVLLGSTTDPVAVLVGVCQSSEYLLPILGATEVELAVGAGVPLMVAVPPRLP